MKRLIYLIAFLGIIMTGCYLTPDTQTTESTTEPSQISNTTVPSQTADTQTGWPSGEIQTQMIYINGWLYVYDDNGTSLTQLPGNAVELGITVAEHKREVPNEELHATHCPVGTKVYGSESDLLHIYAYDESLALFVPFVRADQVECWWE